ncbi:reverse transcriptase family protein [Massilia sp. Mn16-1_5]|uniref:reverse transcriptase family protein n=1 Tax=Massilia sp. Mn16-1_5 TaxID=2079199 RepID=UPI00109E5BE1|nr:reverse transcriptase family protein [Massilia sp. Mn16-1_5]THC45867.1 RNA-directed DNA polymerase [Massilia sp. Mn16-1_5]
MQWNPNLFRKEGNARGYDDLYLNALVSQGQRTAARGLPVVFSLAHLANLSRTLYADLHGFVSRSGIEYPDFPYKNFPIAKRTGGKRWISIPVPQLMAVQQWINQNILNKVVPHPAAFAYVPKRRLIEHASLHCGADWIIKIDIKDFFSNISEKQVFNVFLGLGYPALLSFEMARICTRVTPLRKGARWKNSFKAHSISSYDSRFVGSLPQGAPTSPALSNLVCMKMDEELTEWAISKSVTYSRYADDLCFSFVNSSRQSAYDLQREVTKILRKHGFSDNGKKTRIIPPGARKTLTGLNINAASPSIPKEVRDSIRLHLYFSEKNGISEHCEKRGFYSIIGFKHHLFGLISYVLSVDKSKGEKFRQQFNALPWLDFEN